MHKPQWILFDVGGVLLDWRKSSEALSQKLNIEHAKLLDKMFEYAPQMNIGKISPQDGWEKILNELGSSMQPQAAIELWRDSEFWLKGTLSLVNDLHRAGYKLAIFTNSWLGLANNGNDPTMPKELSLFSFILDSSVEKTKKPDTTFYKIAEKSIQASGQDIFLIDDEEANMVTAAEQNWQKFHFDIDTNRDGKRSLSQLRRILLK